jgi:hypothetical protein
MLEHSKRTRILRYLRRKDLPIPAIDEEAVLDEAKKLPLLGVGQADLISYLKNHGSAQTAAAFYLYCLKNFSKSKLPAKKIKRIYMIPGAFHQQFPEFNADGKLVRELAKKLNLPVVTASLPNFDSVIRNANVIQNDLEKMTDDQTLVVSLSKGSADFIYLLIKNPLLQQKVSSWISIGGLTRGSPDIDRFLSISDGKIPFLKRMLGNFVGWLYGGSIKSISSLASGPNSPLATLSYPSALPFPVTSIVAVPMPHHVSLFLRKRYFRMQKYGPNDGLSLLADSFYPNSQVIPVLGADHFFLIPGFSMILNRSLENALKFDPAD